MTSPVKTKRKVAELEGAELDYWVAKAEYADERPITCAPRYAFTNERISWEHTWEMAQRYKWAPSSDWQIGGPIIDRERLHIIPIPETRDTYRWACQSEAWQDVSPRFFGPTILIAAMRYVVFSKFGDTVETED